MSSELNKIFPAKLKERLKEHDFVREGFTELRFRADGPVVFLRGNEEWFLHKNGSMERSQHFPAQEQYRMPVNEIREMMEYISNFSIYAYEEELRQGFLTLQGGHRVGVCGKAVLAEGRIKTIRNISFLNVRIAREKKGCAMQVMPFLYEDGRLCHTVIISPPGCGKTTLLRDVIRLVSDGNGQNPGQKVGVVDERSELAACYHGVPQNDLGIRTDVLDGCPKAVGMELLLRAMSPQVIAVDELGGNADMEMVEKSIYCGCTVLATVHGESMENWFVKGGMEKRIGDSMFERYVFLKDKKYPGTIEAVCNRSGERIC